ncbi:rhombosortase [Ralstonia pickettii]|uniref:rhombosortase n=1 Tax=Ralstonia pickettii TaxID=329 RepID=UPI0027144B31|nr:rhombosortase [Ralstonia pickettii]WKZ84605.1 rhombosortase [Ralstonia pickettii]
MTAYPHTLRTWGACAGVAALSAAFSFVPWLYAVGLYQRDAVRAGQWWRIATAMWVHLDTWHWLADAMAAIGLILLLARAVRLQGIVGALVACGVLVQLALISQPNVQWYGGLSGALHGLAAWGGLRLLKPSADEGDDRFSRSIGVALCAGVLVKVWLEQSWLSPIAYDPHWGFGVVRIAHAFGAVSGLLIWVLGEWRAQGKGQAQG